MSGFRVLPEAAAELDDIWLYVVRESASIETANRLIDTLTERLLFFTSCEAAATLKGDCALERGRP